MPSLRRRGSRFANSSTSSGRSLRVVGSPPEMLRFSTASQNGLSMTPSISASVMSSLRLPRFQLLHIVQRASQTKVQLKMRTVGRIGRNWAIALFARSRGTPTAVLER